MPLQGIWNHSQMRVWKLEMYCIFDIKRPFCLRTFHRSFNLVIMIGSYIPIMDSWKRKSSKTCLVQNSHIQCTDDLLCMTDIDRYYVVSTFVIFTLTYWIIYCLFLLQTDIDSEGTVSPILRNQFPTSKTSDRL